MQDALKIRLERLAVEHQTISYGALARELKIPSPGSIARLTAMLEASMVEDVTAGRALRAALVVGRLNDEMPASGFFIAAQELGAFDGVDPARFLAEQRETLWT